MKKTLIILGMVVGLVGFMAVGAMATPILAGQTGLVPSIDSFAGTQVGSAINVTFNSGTFTGNATEWVYNDAGNYNFYYQVKDTSGDAITQVTVSDYTGFTTNAVQFKPVFGQNAVSTVDRSLVGNDLEFQFSANPLSPGDTSVIFGVETNATSYGPGIISYIDSVPTSNKVDGPTSVPEPATLLLLGIALLGLGLVGLRWKGKA